MSGAPGPSAGPPQAGPRQPRDAAGTQAVHARAGGHGAAAIVPLGGSLSVPGRRGAPITHLLYLHGFRSSPQSAKARQTAHWMQAHRPDVHWWCPQLPAAPDAVLQMLRDGTAGWPRDTMAVIGSSLGGFFATVLAEATGCRAVVLNPAVNPARDLAQHVGQQPSWHDPTVTIDVRPEFGDHLRAMTPGPLQHPARYFAVIAKGDEVLDWREMAARYAGAQVMLLEGGDHALTDYEQHLPAVLRFLALA